MLIPKATLSAKEDAIALRWEMCQNLHVGFSFLRQTVFAFIHQEAVQYHPREPLCQGCEFVFQLCQFPLMCPCPVAPTPIFCFFSLQVRLMMLPAYFIVYLGNQMR